MQKGIAAALKPHVSESETLAINLGCCIVFCLKNQIALILSPILSLSEKSKCYQL